MRAWTSAGQAAMAREDSRTRRRAEREGEKRNSTGAAAHPEEVDEAAPDQWHASIHAPNVPAVARPCQPVVAQITPNSYRIEGVSETVSGILRRSGPTGTRTPYSCGMG